MRRLDAQDRRLQRVHAKVAADQMMNVPRLHAVRAHQTRALREVVVVGRHQAGIAERAEILAREKREAAERADAAGRAPLVGRADRLRRVFDHWNAALRRDVHHGVHVGSQTEQVHRQDGFGPRGHRRRDTLGIDVVGRQIDIDEDRPRAEPRDRSRRREKRVGRRHDLVSRLDTERHQRQQQRIGARRHRDRVSDAQQLGQLTLETGDFRPQDEALAVADAGHRREKLLAQRTVLSLEIEQRNGRGHRRLFYRPRDLTAARVSRSTSRRLIVSRLS